VHADDFTEIGRIVARALQPGFEDAREELAERVAAVVERYPLYANLGVGAAV
jgi:glycine hydroxymethyltransferase